MKDETLLIDAPPTLSAPVTGPNPLISPLLSWLTGVETVVLLAAGLLMFFLPAQVAPHWPWELKPFSVRFIAGLYSAACVSTALQVWYGRWAPARVVTPMIFLFTLVVLAVSLLYLDRFNWQSKVTLAWFFLYVILPLNAGFHLWRYRHWPPAEAAPTAPGARRILTIQAGALGAYGLAMLFLPVTATAFWPWKVDAFHAQLYSVAFLTPALGAWLLRRAAARPEWLTLGCTQAVLGLFPLIGLVWVDSALRKVNWAAAGVWLWCGVFAGIFLVGLWMLGRIKMSRA